MGWPVLASEVSTICKELKIPDATVKDVDKTTINKAIKYHHLTALKEELTEIKLREMENSDVSERRAYPSWNVLDYWIAYGLETRMFICRANMTTMFKRNLSCHAYIPGADIILYM